MMFSYVDGDWLVVYLPELTKYVSVLSKEMTVRFYSLRFTCGDIYDDTAQYDSLANLLYLNSHWATEAPIR